MKYCTEVFCDCKSCGAAQLSDVVKFQWKWLLFWLGLNSWFILYCQFPVFVVRGVAFELLLLPRPCRVCTRDRYTCIGCSAFGDRRIVWSAEVDGRNLLGKNNSGKITPEWGVISRTIRYPNNVLAITYFIWSQIFFYGRNHLRFLSENFSKKKKVKLCIFEVNTI